MHPGGAPLLLRVYTDPPNPSAFAAARQSAADVSKCALVQCRPAWPGLVRISFTACPVCEATGHSKQEETTNSNGSGKIDMFSFQ